MATRQEKEITGTVPSRKFTNIPGKGPDWTYFSDFEKPRELTPEEKGKIRGPGAEAAPSIGAEFARGWEEDPRLGARPQGTWDYETVKRTFPGMIDERALRQEEFEKLQEIDKEVRKDPRLQGFEDMPQMLNRDKFEQSVLQTIGGNPFAIDPVAEMNAATKNLPQLFNEVFEGKIAWADRGKLTKEQAEWWNEQKKAYRARVLSTAQSKRQTMIDQYNIAMNRFDYYEKTRNAALKERLAKEEALAKPTEKMKARGPDGLLHWFEWDPNKRDWIDSGRIATSLQEDVGLPPALRQAAALYKQLAPQQDPMMVWAVSMAMSNMKPDDPARSALEGMLNKGVLPGMENRADNLRKVIGRLLDEYTRDFAAKRGIATVTEKKDTEKKGAPEEEVTEEGAAGGKTEYVYDPKLKKAVPKK